MVMKADFSKAEENQLKLIREPKLAESKEFYTFPARSVAKSGSNS